MLGVFNVCIDSSDAATRGVLQKKQQFLKVAVSTKNNFLVGCIS